jgi:poly-gamma-glutamate synthesis protein (capsule biosynthesis protein)
MLRYKTDAETLDKIAKSLQDTLPKDAVIIASIDFSHYQILPSANFHDELTEQIVKNFDYSRFSKLEIDSEPSLYLLSKMMEYYGTQKVAFELRDNSANILKNPGLKETTSYYSPYFVNGKKENIKISSILNFGDIMLDRNVKAQIDKNGSDYIFKELAGQENRFLTGMDIIEANLEGPFANYRRETTKSIAFRFDPKLIATLLKYNFGLFSLANNHSLDMSKKGFEESKENLKSAGINFYGQQFFITDENLLVKQIGDFKFGLIGLDDTVNKIDIVKVKKLVENAKTQGAEIILANVHWGDEYKTVSNAQQRQLAHDLVDLGVDVIIGHHPHVVQEMEIYKNRPIFYSLGNFIFDQYFSVLTQQGLAVGLIFKQNESKIQLSTYVFPIEGAKSQTKLMDYEKTQKFFDAWLKTSRLENNQFENYNLKINF